MTLVGTIIIGILAVGGWFSAHIAGAAYVLAEQPEQQSKRKKMLANAVVRSIFSAFMIALSLYLVSR